MSLTFASNLDRLYRFRSLSNEFGRLSAEDILLHNRMFWASPTSFNDPMDCRPNLIFGRNSRDRAEWLKAAIARQLADRSRDERRRTLRRMQAVDVEAHERNFRSIFNRFMAESAVCCLAKTAENVLLWSHYADCHRGVAYVFEEAMSPNPFIAFDVVYSDIRPVVDATVFAGNLQAMKDSVLTKASDWSYEQEKRLLDYREPAGYRSFSPSVLKGVIFGSMISSEDERFIRSLVERRRHPTQLWRSQLSETEYRMEIISA